MLELFDVPGLPNLPSIAFDWEAYYLNFKSMHGGDPVGYNEHQTLFPDGWRYSSTNYAGPEYPPENDEERISLMQEYWRIRRKVCEEELKRISYIIRNLNEFQQSRTYVQKDGTILQHPLFRLLRYESEDIAGNIELVQRTEQLDLTDLQLRAKWLSSDIRSCDQRLNRIAKDKKYIPPLPGETVTPMVPLEELAQEEPSTQPSSTTEYSDDD